MKKIFSTLLMLWYISSNCYGFSTLEQASLLAASLEEFPPIDNENYFNPRYDLYNKKRTSREHSVLTRLYSIVGLQKNPWDNQTFIALLTKVATQRINTNMHGNFIQKLTVPSGHKFIIFSNLQGAFHSFVRNLNHLKQWNIIDNNFKIKNKDYHIVINGHAIDRSAYNLETLLLIFNLLLANPDQVIYVRGNDEFGRWIDYDLKKEVQIRLGNNSEEIPLQKELNAFFDTLPLALYVNHDQNKTPQFICFSQLKDTGSILDNHSYSDFLMSNNTGIHHINTTESIKQEAPIVALFKEGAIGSELFYDRGLSYFVPEKYPAHWHLLSCPTTAYKDVLLNDSFVILDTQADIRSWALLHYTQDIHLKAPLEVKVYDLVTGTRLFRKQFWGKKSTLLSLKDIFLLPNNETKVPAFYVGSTMDFSASMHIGIALFEGFSVRVNKENEQGGINKQMLKFLFLNDSYSVAQSYNNILKMLNQKIDTQVMLFDSQAFLAALPLIMDKKLICLFPDVGIAASRKKNLTNVVHFMAPYTSEVPILINKALDELKLQRIAIFYQNDAFGLENLAIAKQLFEQREFNNYIAVPYKRGSSDLTTEAEKINNFNPDTVIFFATALPAITLINAMNLTKISTLPLMGIHPLSFPEFTNFLENKGLHMMLTNVVPNPTDTQLPIVAQYQETMHSRGFYKFSPYSLNGYINATLLIEVLKKIHKPIAKEKIIEEFESMENFNLGGINLTFNIKTRTLSNHVWLWDNDTWQHFSE